MVLVLAEPLLLTDFRLEVCVELLASAIEPGSFRADRYDRCAT